MADPNSLEETRAFEAEVRRIAEVMWGLNPGECQPEHYEKAAPLHELDGMARLPEITHLIMVTVSTKLEKARSDISKLEKAESLEKRRGAAVVKWLVTRVQLDAQHESKLRLCFDIGSAEARRGLEDARG
jgi:hypothetical protein